LDSRPGDGDRCKVFVGGLPRDTAATALEDHFSKYGTIVDKVVMKDGKGRGRGFGFVQFPTEDSVDQVMDDYKNHQVSGKWVEVKRCEPRRDGDSFGGDQERRRSRSPHRGHDNPDDVGGGGWGAEGEVPEGAEGAPLPDELPPDWEAVEDDEGGIYYHHIISGHTQWEHPGPEGEEFEDAEDVERDGEEEVRPQDWEEVEGDDGQVYYHNTVTGETMLDPPAGFMA
jgi:RNA recognition motif-containing protein